MSYTIEKIKEMLIDSSADEHYIVSCQPTPISGKGYVGKSFNVYYQLNETNIKRGDITLLADNLGINSLIEWLNETGQRYIDFKLKKFEKENARYNRTTGCEDNDEELDVDDDWRPYDDEETSWPDDIIQL